MKEILYTAIHASLEAGEEIMQIYTNPNSDFQIERKSDNSPLTLADKASHLKIMQFLINTPYPTVSEEGKDIAYAERKGWDMLWMVDPLDGTKEFIKQNGEFTVNIALIDKGVPVLGVIYLPVKEVLYFGCIEHGAYRIEHITMHNMPQTIEAMLAQAAQLPIEQEERPYRIVASRSHQSAETQEFIEKKRLEHSNIELVSSGSSIKICMVAEGTADVYPRFAPTMEWDTAAGHAIAKAAGKDIVHIDQPTPLVYNKENLLNPFFIVQ